MSELAGTVLGRCRLGPVIGQGSMGVVYEGVHLTLNIPVAVKILREPAFGEDAFRYRERFRREARLAARLNHPGLVRVLDFGEEGDLPYLVMELVRGQTLDQILRRHGQLSERLALQVVGHVAVAVFVAHSAGIVHRDLKPSNIILDGDKGLKVSDLGLAREHASPGVTMATGLVGTPHYMAPESWEPGRDPDPRSDLYSMGVILYQMLFARLPFQGSPTQILKGHISSTPQWDPPEGGYRPSEGTMAILKRLLEKDPSRRFQDAASVAEACRQMLSGMSRGSSGTRPGRATPTESEADSRGILSRMESRLEASTIQGGRRILHTTGRERVLLWVLLLLLVAGALAGWFLR
jgi:eukaryotic-like serine/threonine-protein kinase